MRAALGLIATLLLAGCLSGAPTPPGPGDVVPGLARWAEQALPMGHDHADPALHANLTTPNFHMVGWDPLLSPSYGTSIPGTLCGDVVEDGGRRLAAIQGRNDIVAIIADVTDPAHPKFLGEVVMRTTYAYDVAAVADGQHIALVTTLPRMPDQPLPGARALDAPTAPGIWWRSACAPGAWRNLLAQLPGEDLLPHPDQLVLISIADPAQPQVVDQVPLGGYGHGVSSAKAGSQVVVAAAAMGPLPVGVPGNDLSAYTQNFHFYEVVPGPAGGKLVPLSVWTPPPPVGPELAALHSASGHDDVWISEHPGTHQPLVWIAAGDLGLFILDFSDPHQLQLLGRWNDFDPVRPDDTGSFHSVHAMPGLWEDGRHYTVVGPEFGGRPVDVPTGVVHVLDTTDPSQPRGVASWTLPYDTAWDDFLQFSTHYLTVVGHTLLVSMYHGGIWAVDLGGIGTQEWVNLPSVGVFMAYNASPAPPERPVRWAPTFEEVQAFPDGTMLTFEANTGVYAFRFDEALPMPAPRPWPLASTP